MLKLENLKKDIKTICIDNQGCFVNKSIWLEYEKNNDFLKKFNQSFFYENEPSKKITKKELFILAKNPSKTKEFIISTIYWGFSNDFLEDYRKKNFPIITNATNFLNIENTLNILRNKNVTSFQNEIQNKFISPYIKSVKTSTYSKFLFFLKTKINADECLILDNKIIPKLKYFDELQSLNYLTDSNKDENYDKYVFEMNKVSRILSVKPEQLEAFIFNY